MKEEFAVLICTVYKDILFVAFTLSLSHLTLYTSKLPPTLMTEGAEGGWGEGCRWWFSLSCYVLSLVPSLKADSVSWIYFVGSAYVEYNLWKHFLFIIIWSQFNSLSYRKLNYWQMQFLLLSTLLSVSKVQIWLCHFPSCKTLELLIIQDKVQSFYHGLQVFHVSWSSTC